MRDQAISVKNAAEQELDHLSEKVSGSKAHSSMLGESRADTHGHSKWKSAVQSEQGILRQKQTQVKQLVEESRKISLDAAKIQEEQYEASDASSHLDVNAHVMSKKLSAGKGDILGLKNNHPSAKDLRSELSKMATKDHKIYMDLAQLSGEASNAESAEEAGLKATNDEVALGSKLLHN